jgi:predicted transposase YbfD/YdcC
LAVCPIRRGGLERHVERVRDGKTSCEVDYVVTSLDSQQASPERLMELVRNHWHIENKLHYRRDETLREDWCHLRVGHSQSTMASINNLVPGLLAKRKVTNVPRIRRRFSAYWNEALQLVAS